MGKIFALEGKEKCGKTPTLKLVRDEIVKKYNVQPSQIHEFSSNPGDIKITIEIEVSVKIKVGIASQGDVGKYFILDTTLADFEKAGCDIIFCACRTSGKTKECIEAHTKYTHKFVEQTPPPAGSTAQQETQSNVLVAQNLIHHAEL